MPLSLTAIGSIALDEIVLFAVAGQLDGNTVKILWVSLLTTQPKSLSGLGQKYTAT